MAPRRRCPVCQSRQWHKEPASGLVVCSEGHVLQNYRNEATDAEELGPHALRKRALKSGRKKGGKGSKADPKLYHGPRAQFHYFQCQQLILRFQIMALTKLWDLPSEFETICRDLWALHLSLLPSPPPPEPYFYTQDQQGIQRDGEDSDDSGHEESGQKARKLESIRSSDDVHDDSYSSDHSDESDIRRTKQRDRDDEELEALMRENSESELSTSSDDDQDSSAKKNTAEESKRKKRKGKHSQEGLQNTLVVLVLALWTLRIPFIYKDLARLIELYELPYLEALRLLPKNMSRHLTRDNVRSLSPGHAPQTMKLHMLVSRLAKRLYSKYGILTPEVNGAPLLWRAIKYMGGSPVLYKLCKRMAHVLSLPLTLHHTLSPALVKAKRWDPESHRSDDVPIEVSVIAVIVVVLKMLYGVDGRAEIPDDLAGSLPTAEEYVRRLSEAKEDMFSSTSEMCVGDLGEEELDEYLDFCQKALLGREEDDATLASYFPVRNAGTTGTGERVVGVESMIARCALWTGVRKEEVERVVGTYDRRVGRSYK